MYVYVEKNKLYPVVNCEHHHISFFNSSCLTAHSYLCTRTIHYVNDLLAHSSPVRQMTWSYSSVKACTTWPFSARYVLLLAS